MSFVLTRRGVLAGAAGLAIASPAAGAPPLDLVVTRARIAQLGRLRYRCAVGRGGSHRP